MRVRGGSRFVRSSVGLAGTSEVVGERDLVGGRRSRPRRWLVAGGRWSVVGGPGRGEAGSCWHSRFCRRTKPWKPCPKPCRARSPSGLVGPVVLAMHGLFRDAEPDRDLPPGPASPARGRHLLSLQLLHEPAQPGNGPQPRVGIRGAHRLSEPDAKVGTKIGAGTGAGTGGRGVRHERQHMLTKRSVNTC